MERISRELEQYTVKEGKEFYVKELEHLGKLCEYKKQFKNILLPRERKTLAHSQGCGHSHLQCINFLAALFDNSCFWRPDISSHLKFLHIKHFPL